MPRSLRSTRPERGRAVGRCTSRSSRVSTGHDAAVHGLRHRGGNRAGRLRGARPEPRGGGWRRASPRRGVDVELVDSFESRALERGVADVGHAQAPVRHLQGCSDPRRPRDRPRPALGDGEESRRLVHELRAEVDAVAVGGGTVRADLPRLDARDVPTPNGQPRRLAFSRGPAPGGGRARAPHRAARGGVARAGRRRCPVAAAGRRADPRRRVSGSRPGRQAPSFRRADARRGRPRRRPAASLPSPRTLPGCAPGRSGPTCSSKRMSTSPESQRADDQIVTHSQPLADPPARQRRAAPQGARTSAPTSFLRAAERRSASCSPSCRRPSRASAPSSRCSSARRSRRSSTATDGRGSRGCPRASGGSGRVSPIDAGRRPARAPRPAAAPRR